MELSTVFCHPEGARKARGDGAELTPGASGAIIVMKMCVCARRDVYRHGNGE